MSWRSCWSVVEGCWRFPRLSPLVTSVELLHLHHYWDWHTGSRNHKIQIAHGQYRKLHMHMAERLFQITELHRILQAWYVCSITLMMHSIEKVLKSKYAHSNLNSFSLVLSLTMTIFCRAGLQISSPHTLVYTSTCQKRGWVKYPWEWICWRSERGSMS